MVGKRGFELSPRIGAALLCGCHVPVTFQYCALQSNTLLDSPKIGPVSACNYYTGNEAEFRKRTLKTPYPRLTGVRKEGDKMRYDDLLNNKMLIMAVADYASHICDDIWIGRMESHFRLKHALEILTGERKYTIFRPFESKEIGVKLSYDDSVKIIWDAIRQAVELSKEFDKFQHTTAPADEGKEE